MARNRALKALPLFEQTALPVVGFENEVREFCAFGAKTEHLVQEGIPYFVNEFWTAGQRQAHAIHEVSYRACFKPQLPEFFISRLTNTGDGVYDPFMGRGTTPVQAALQGRRPIGNDINPLSILLTRPRLAPPSLPVIERRLKEISWHAVEIERDDLLAFYHVETLRQICALRRYLLEHAPLDKEPDPVDDWIRMVAINRLTGHSPGFFSVYSLPPNQAVSVESQLKINAKRNQNSTDPRRGEAHFKEVARAFVRRTTSASPKSNSWDIRGMGYALHCGRLRKSYRYVAAVSGHRAIRQRQLVAQLVRWHRPEHRHDFNAP